MIENMHDENKSERVDKNEWNDPPEREEISFAAGIIALLLIFGAGILVGAALMGWRPF